jgi:hypothetical protein
VTDLPPADAIDLFDEAGYLRLYPGIAEAIMRGDAISARDHYLEFGRAEGRQPNDVDPTFYLAAYPTIQNDLGRLPEPADAARHFVTLGRARGYRPNAAAPRPANGAAHFSPFGGGWLDHGDALDMISARGRLGRLRPWEAEILGRFATDGHAWFDRPMDNDKMTAAAQAIEQAFGGRWPAARFISDEASGDVRSWDPGLVAHPAMVLDPHMLSEAVRAIVLDPRLMAFLALMFDAPACLTFSRAGLRQTWSPDRDVAWFSHSQPLRFLAVTFCLEEAATDLISVWPGSHRLPDLPWRDGCPVLDDARRMGPVDLERRAADVARLIRDRTSMALEMKFGDRLIRHANLVHMMRAPAPARRHRFLTAWYCPDHVIPGYQEAGEVRSHEREGIGFSSGAYPDMDPAD